MLKRSLSIAHIMENGDMCAPKGIRIPVAIHQVTAELHSYLQTEMV